jgi:glutaredoxin 3
MNVTVYSTDWCPYCDRAKALLKARGIDYNEIRIDEDPDFRAKLVQMTGQRTVPQIQIDGTFIGGFTELRALDQRGELVPA